MIEPKVNGSVLHYDENLLRVPVSRFERARGEDGFRFELIQGVLHVSPSPDPYEQDISLAIYNLLRTYRGPDGASAFAHVTTEPRIFVSDAENDGTVPQPDVAAYLAYPPKPVDSYRGLIPALVVEVVSRWGRNKDYVRNVEVYGNCPDILEYWIVDPSRDHARPSMSVLRRAVAGTPFERMDIPSGGTYECPRWPGLRVDLSRIAVE